jgi:hypothetical protein
MAKFANEWPNGPLASTMTPARLNEEARVHWSWVMFEIYDEVASWSKAKTARIKKKLLALAKSGADRPRLLSDDQQERELAAALIAYTTPPQETGEVARTVPHSERTDWLTQ